MSGYPISTVVATAEDRNLVALADLKADLSITDTADDTFLERAIAKASAAIEGYCERVFAVERVQDYFHCPKAGRELMLSRCPITTVVSVVEDGATLVEGTDFLVDSEAGILVRIAGCYWDKTATVIFEGGYQTIPLDLQSAATEVVKSLQFTRTRDPMLRSENILSGLYAYTLMDPGASTSGMPASVQARPRQVSHAVSVADSITNALLRFGRPMTLRRKFWTGNEFSTQDVQIFGVTEGPLSEELVSGVSSVGEATVTFSNAQIADAGWPGPPDKLDEMIIDDGEARTIRTVETKYLGSQVLVYVAKVLALNYDRMIRIERYAVTSTDDYGNDVQQWAELATVQASKTDLSGDEAREAAQLSASVVTRFRVPWSVETADVSAQDRIVYPTNDGEVYEIKTVKELMLKAGFEILTTKAA